jgi:hypothetical protein
LKEKLVSVEVSKEIFLNRQLVNIFFLTATHDFDMNLMGFLCDKFDYDVFCWIS